MLNLKLWLRLVVWDSLCQEKSRQEQKLGVTDPDDDDDLGPLLCHGSQEENVLRSDDLLWQPFCTQF